MVGSLLQLQDVTCKWRIKLVMQKAEAGCATTITTEYEVLQWEKTVQKHKQDIDYLVNSDLQLHVLGGFYNTAEQFGTNADQMAMSLEGKTDTEALSGDKEENNIYFWTPMATRVYNCSLGP